MAFVYANTGSGPSAGGIGWFDFGPDFSIIQGKTFLNEPTPVLTKTADKAYAKPGDLINYTVSVYNPSGSAALNNVTVTDPAPAGTTYAGGLFVSVPYTGIDPSLGITLSSIPAATTATVSWIVQINEGTPQSSLISNTAIISSSTFTGETNAAETQIKYADLSAPGSFIKTASTQGAKPGEVITYSISVTNTGNMPANNIVITDPIPAGTTYVSNSVTGTVLFTGTPAFGITLTEPLGAGEAAAFTFKVKVNDTFPPVNPIPNTAYAVYDFTVDPSQPNGAFGMGISNTAYVTVGVANLISEKAADKFIAYPGDIITYSLAISNFGNLSADNVVITDPIPAGTVYMPASITSNVPFTGSPVTAIMLTNPIAAGQTAALSFKVQIKAVPNPNPIRNVATVSYAYTLDPENPDGVTAVSISNGAQTAVFMNNYSQQINDLVESIALEEAAIAAILNAEGAKIQRFASMPDVSPQMLVCLNKSVTDMTDSITMFETVLRQKLSTVDCQITGECP